ncbi:MFS transporter [Xylophilus rhododendri]|uniref:MFS transporter n=1 Tax=Xylophilus rhododendri TaxID=2697032 RepID=A0A857J7H6_9BURK|nr:MFS transporter [Xylophilus rhododendri]QHI99806.1 MFS transporter [Xylophilus rhododendri]
MRSPSLLRTGPALAALTAAFAMSQFFRSCLAVMAPELSADLGLDPAGFGALSSAFFLAFGLIQVPVGVAFDRWGVGRPTSVLMALGVAGGLMFSLSHGAAMATLGQVGLGMACAPVFMGLIHYASEQLEERRYLRSLSVSNGLGMLGVLCAASPLGWAVQHFGWRPAMLVATGVMAVVCFAVQRTVRDRGHADAHGQSSLAMLRGSLVLLKVPALWALVPVCLGMASGTAFRNAWGGPYVADVFGLDPISRGSAMTVISFVAFGCAFAMPLAARRFGAQAVIVGTMLGSVLAGLGLMLMPDVSLGLDLALLSLLAAAGTLHPVVMTAGRGTVAPALRGRALGVLNTFVFVGMAAASAGYGWLARYGMRLGRSPGTVYAGLFGLAVLALLMALAPFAWSAWRRRAATA